MLRTRWDPDNGIILIPMTELPPIRTSGGSDPDPIETRTMKDGAGTRNWGLPSDVRSCWQCQAVSLGVRMCDRRRSDEKIRSRWTFAVAFGDLLSPRGLEGVEIEWKLLHRSST